MTRAILGVIAFVLLAEHLSTFLVLLVSITEIDAGVLSGSVQGHGLSLPQMTRSDLQLLWAFLGSVVIVGIALIFVFLDMALFRTRYVKIGLTLCGIHFVVLLSWIILGATIYSQPYAQGSIYFSVFVNHMRPQLFLGCAASFLTFISLLIKPSRARRPKKPGQFTDELKKPD